MIPAPLVKKIGAGTVDRTPDLRVTSALLYQLSYAGTAGRSIGKPRAAGKPAKTAPPELIESVRNKMKRRNSMPGKFTR